jgi:hypothetical protein
MNFLEFTISRLDTLVNRRFSFTFKDAKGTRKTLLTQQIISKMLGSAHTHSVIAYSLLYLLAGISIFKRALSDNCSAFL